MAVNWENNQIAKDNASNRANRSDTSFAPIFTTGFEDGKRLDAKQFNYLANACGESFDELQKGGFLEKVSSKTIPNGGLVQATDNNNPIQLIKRGQSFNPCFRDPNAISKRINYSSSTSDLTVGYTGSAANTFSTPTLTVSMNKKVTNKLDYIGTTKPDRTLFEINAYFIPDSSGNFFGAYDYSETDLGSRWRRFLLVWRYAVKLYVLIEPNNPFHREYIYQTFIAQQFDSVLVRNQNPKNIRILIDEATNSLANDIRVEFELTIQMLNGTLIAGSGADQVKIRRRGSIIVTCNEVWGDHYMNLNDDI